MKTLKTDPQQKVDNEVEKHRDKDEFPVFYTERFEWSAGNCIYKGGHADLNASIDSTAWHIYKYDYDGSNNCEMIRFAQGAWSNRTNLWT